MTDTPTFRGYGAHVKHHPDAFSRPVQLQPLQKNWLMTQASPVEQAIYGPVFGNEFRDNAGVGNLASYPVASAPPSNELNYQYLPAPPARVLPLSSRRA